MSRYNHDVDIDPLDLSEAPRLAKTDSYPRGAVIGGSFLGLFFIAMLIYGSLPELSPQEIIAMDGYAGERPTKHIFNLQDMDEGEQAAEPVAETAATVPAAETAVIEAPKVVVQPEPVIQPQPKLQQTVVEQEVVDPVVVNEIIKPEVAEPVVETVAVVEQPQIVPAPVSKTEIDLAVERNKALYGGAERKEASAMASTPALDESTSTVVVSSVVAAEPAPMPIRPTEYKYSELSRTPAIGSVTGTKNEASRLLPLRSVLDDYTELKESPSLRSRTKMTLGKGVQVTAFEKQGDWVLVGANDGSSVTGYVLETQIGKPQER